MTPFFIHLDWFDPNGQTHMAEGDVYGGERSFMVGHAEDMADFLLGLLEVLEREGFTLQRILVAGPPEDYEDDTAPEFEIDLNALIEEARANDVLVAKPSLTFSPHGRADSGKSLALIDIFDPNASQEEDYAGQIHEVALMGPPHEALVALVSLVKEEGCTLKALMALFDAEDRDYLSQDAESVDARLELLGSVQPGAPAWGPGIYYGSEEDT